MMICEPGVEIAALDAPDDLGLGQVPDLGRVAELEPVLEEHGAHRAVGHDRAAVLEQLAEAGAGLAVVEGAARGRVREGGVIDGRRGAPGRAASRRVSGVRIRRRGPSMRAS